MPEPETHGIIALPDDVSTAPGLVIHASSQAGFQAWVTSPQKAGGIDVDAPVLTDIEHRLDERMRACHRCDRLSPTARDEARSRALADIARNLSREPHTLPERVWKDLRR